MPQGPLGERIPFEGVLNCWNDDHDLPDLLLAISRSGKTGRLHFSNPEGDKSLDLRAGRVVFAESSSQDDGLGQFLLRTGEISLMDYTRVSKLVQPGKRLGALLVEEHVLHEDNLTPAVIGQVRSIILGLFRRTESWYRFKEEELEAKESITLDLAVPELVLEGVGYVESWRRISKGVGNLESVYQQAVPYEQEWLSSKLGDDVRELIRMLESPTSLAEICEHATLPDFEACRYLWAFRSLGWIDIVEATASVAVTTSAVEEEPSVPVPPTPTPIPESLVATQLSIETDLAPAPEPVAAAREDAAPSPIPEHLIETQISMTPPGAPAEVETAPPKPPKIPDHLNVTQLSIDPPPETPCAPPQAIPPKAIPEELMHTQMFMEPPTPPREDEDPEETPTLRSTGEFMESILEGETSPPPVAKPPVAPPAAPAPAPPEPTNHATTQFFEGPNALAPNGTEPTAPSPTHPTQASERASAPAAPEPPALKPPIAATTEPAGAPPEAPSGFEALALGDDLGPASPPPATTRNPLTPNPADVATQPSVHQPVPAADTGMASFSDLALSDAAVEPPPEALAPEPLPLVEADVVAVDPPPPVGPAAPQPYVPDEPLLPQSRAMEITQESLIPPRRRLDDLDPSSDGVAHRFGIDDK